MGRGAFGTVYRAVDMHLQRPVAIKILDPAVLVDEKVRRRFFREARILAGLDHPAIVRIFYAGSSDRGPYYAMEMLTGGSLRVMLKRQPVLEERVVVQLLEDILPGLGTLHDASVVHRDLKPANILFTDVMHAKIADFGLAVEDASARLTTVGSVLGTPPYMAPEQWQGEDPTLQADLYAIGVIVFECLTGNLPFQAKTIPQLANQVCNTPVNLDPLRALSRGKQWIAFLGPLLEKTPAARPESAWAALNRLSALRGEQWMGTVEHAPPTLSAGETFPASDEVTPAPPREPAVVDMGQSWSLSPPRDAPQARATAPPATPRPTHPATEAAPSVQRPRAPTAPRASAAAAPASVAPPWSRVALLAAGGTAIASMVLAGFLAVRGGQSRTEGADLRTAIARLEVELGQLRAERRRLSVRNVKLEGNLAAVMNTLYPASETFAFDAHLTTEVAGARCGIRFTHAPGDTQRLTFELQVLNTSAQSVPGGMDVHVLDEAGERLAQVRVNVLPGRPGARLAPGARGTVAGALRLPTATSVPARFQLQFVETGA